MVLDTVAICRGNQSWLWCRHPARSPWLITVTFGQLVRKDHGTNLAFIDKSPASPPMPSIEAGATGTSNENSPGVHWCMASTWWRRGLQTMCFASCTWQGSQRKSFLRYETWKGELPIVRLVAGFNGIFGLVSSGCLISTWLMIEA